MKADLSRVHWSQVLSTGVLVVILLFILDLILTFLYIAAHLVLQVYLGSAYLLEFLLIIGAGIWVARKAEGAGPLHGLLVGLVVALMGILFSLVMRRSFGSSALVVLGEFALDVAAGWLGGVLGSRVRERI